MPARGGQLPHQRVEADLRRRLGAGEWEPGTALPSTEQLAGHYGVAKGTVTRALRDLAAEGLVHTIPRWATVAGPPERDAPAP
jgi:DNA-binding GntR family transcriptional regulator